MGDVLTGVIAALLAGGCDPVEAACLGVWSHGRAGDLAAREIGPIGLTADDVAGRVPAALGELIESPIGFRALRD
jgi:NAD(P)H-hydrate epimerase